MCGINGLINFPEAKQKIEAMNKIIAHRGPDAGGVWEDEGICLGHRRLSIIDLSAAADQPLIKNGLVIVYNGEVYNFRSLRKELEDEGVLFNTNSDTEVVLEVFRAWGASGFARMRGMFAFAVCDIAKKELVLARDFFGIKPLYYSFLDNNRFVFSSELKAIAGLGGVRKKLNRKALVAGVNYLWVYGSDSIFEDIKKLPPAHYMRLYLNDRSKPPQIARFWSLPRSSLNLEESKLQDRLAGVFEQSVKRHLVSDVEVGAFLSGGLDSSLICALAKKYNPGLSTYTISISCGDNKVEAMGDDNSYASALAKKLGLNHQDIPVRPDAVKYLKDVVYILDEPIADPAAVNTHLICALAHERGIKVLLSGMGADEIFAGYRRHYALILARRANCLPPPIKAAARALLQIMPVRYGARGVKFTRWAKRFFSFLDMPFERAYMRSYSYYGYEQLRRLFCGNFDAEIDCVYGEHDKIFRTFAGSDYVNKMCYTDINMFMEGLNLAYTDRISMASSVEVRVPYIDVDVVELAMAMAGHYKLRGRTSKYILKRMAENYLPRNIIYRPKASFGMPIRSWISGALKPLVDDLLSFANIKKRGIFDAAAVRRMVDDDRAGRYDYAYQIYQFLTLELWMQRYVD